MRYRAVPHKPMNLKWQDGRFDVSRLIDTRDGRIIAKVSRDSAAGDTD